MIHRQAQRDGLDKLDLVTVFHGLQLDAADAEDRNLRNVQHRRKRLDAGRAEVRDRERTAGQMIGADRTLLALVGQRADRRAQFTHRQRVRIVDDGHHESAWRIHRDAEMNRAVLHHLVA